MAPCIDESVLFIDLYSDFLISIAFRGLLVFT